MPNSCLFLQAICRAAAASREIQGHLTSAVAILTSRRCASFLWVPGDRSFLPPFNACNLVALSNHDKERKGYRMHERTAEIGKSSVGKFAQTISLIFFPFLHFGQTRCTSLRFFNPAAERWFAGVEAVWQVLP